MLTLLSSDAMSMIQPVLAVKQRFPFKLFTKRALFISLILLNLFWGVIGLVPYLPQTKGILFLFWLFIPDCPLYALLFAGLLVKPEKVKNSMQPLVWAVAFSLIKIGLVAPSLFIAFPERYHAPPILGIKLPYIFPLDYFHVTLLLEGLLLVIFFLKKSSRNFVIGFSWLIINDISDFVFLTFPNYSITYIHIQFFLLVYICANLFIFIIGSLLAFEFPKFKKNSLHSQVNYSQIPLVSSFLDEGK